MDLSSYSIPDKAVVTHLDWTASVDFDAKIIQAKATYSVVAQESCQELCLDTSKLRIQNITNLEGEPLDYTMSPPVPGKLYLGQKLTVSLPPHKNKDCSITIVYQTTNECSAAQWLPPSQTAGKKYPYLFTQCQAIHARSLLPCQDRCGVKMTYNATVTVPSWATCVMSALLESSKNDGKDTKVYTWKQPVPISSYLFALAVGELEKIDLSKRCAIWSEPGTIKAAAYEFSETEEFLALAEKIAGKEYVWQRYDLLCLPPSFPYGGMENPCLTFVTPTLLAGDKSLADVVAHEIAHSWTGNLVTNATWDHFWLNEGWTTWFQRKIMVAIKKNPKFLDFDAIDGRKHLGDAIEEMESKNTKLVLDIGDGDPDDSYSAVAYEKGFTFLLYLERLMGTAQFEKFFQAYIGRFASQTLTSEDFKAFFCEFFEHKEEALKSIDWDLWFYGEGMPPVLPELDQSMAAASQSLADQWLAVDREAKAPPAKNEMEYWSSLQITCFLDDLALKIGDQPLKLPTLNAMDALYKFSESRNSEILYRYCELAIPAEDESVIPVAIRFITTQGRMKFVRPLYRALFKTKMGKKLAVDTFLKNKDFYHPIGVKMVAADLSSDYKKSSTTTLSASLDKWLIPGALVAATFAVVAFRTRR
ncbi:unnamed protein product [Cylindrotheca closterium]|uniref:Peptidase M1 leukotriene A4 hydrolase/aminopeptidase C-terminal domain-containing protein n=1 Tax=Cylindrotheca closterium TaxID=2856 RepID=A0AAD2FFI6_9STRA|nr:unnamed protein product [Cylindrotheca closterium]